MHRTETSPLTTGMTKKDRQIMRNWKAPQGFSFARPRDWTPEHVEAVIQLYAQLSLTELRRRQVLTERQISMAHEQGNDGGMKNLQVVEGCLSAAVGRQHFGG